MNDVSNGSVQCTHRYVVWRSHTFKRSKVTVEVRRKQIFFFKLTHTVRVRRVCVACVCVSAMEWRGEERRVVSLLRYDLVQYSPPIVDVSRKSM